MSPFKAVLAFIPALVMTVAACTGPPVNIPTLNILKGFETMQPDAYDDGFGNPTIGYGHLCTDKSCSDVAFPKPLSEGSATRLLQGDLTVSYLPSPLRDIMPNANAIQSTQDAVTNALADLVTLNDNQYGALVSWAFNVGIGNMKSSDLVRLMNAGEEVIAVANYELPLWNKANGKVVTGLVRRRKAEVDLFNAPSEVGALPVPS